MNIEGNNAHWLALQQAFDTPWPGPSGESVILKNENLRLLIDPQDGARIVSLSAFGFDVLRPWHPERRAFQYGCFPMVPWVGRLGNATLKMGNKHYALPANKPPHALHGMACYSLWEVVKQTNKTVVLRSQLSNPWPWQGDVRQVITLDGDTVLLRLEIHSAKESFPASAGWHPWFNKKLDAKRDGPELCVEFTADWQEEAGDDELPTGKKISPQPGPWDDCFGFTHGIHATLNWPGKLSMEMTSPAPSLVVFDKQPDATCVNPLSQAPDAINRDPQFVSPGEPLVIESRWAFKVK